MFIKNDTDTRIKDIIEGNEVIINPKSEIEINNTFGEILLKKYGFLKVVSKEEIKTTKKEEEILTKKEIKTPEVEIKSSIKKSRKGKK